MKVKDSVEEKAAMEAWNLTALTVMHVDEWRDFFAKKFCDGPDLISYRIDHFQSRDFSFHKEMIAPMLNMIAATPDFQMI